IRGFEVKRLPWGRIAVKRRLSERVDVEFSSLPGWLNENSSTMMGACGSCLRLMLDAESDVKIHVIEPTTIVAPEHSVGPPARGQSAGPRLTVPSPAACKNNLRP
ncbi:hypothetical protein Tcan_09773, partial [Toxocara canis]